MSEPVLVIGAGTAGMTAAVELGDWGVKTILIDKKTTVGGNALDLYRAFPTDDCFYCFEGNRTRPGIRKCFYRSALLDQPNIELRVGCTVKSITGQPGQFQVTLQSEPKYVDPKKCTLCGLCIERSKAFRLISPQCQPQAVVYDPSWKDSGVKKAEEDCPTKAIDLDARPTEEHIVVSDIILATGYQEMKPAQIEEYCYGKYRNVITQLEFARILDPLGPSQGIPTRPSDGRPAKHIVMVQCVGSRDENYHSYCSKICCVYALKHAVIAASERNNATVHVVYMDIRTYDRHERYYREARDAGVDFIRGRIQQVVEQNDGTLNVIIYDSLLDKYIKISTDLLVLSSALEPTREEKSITEMLGLSPKDTGFLTPYDVVKEEEVIVGDHIYACGTSLGPAEVPESVTQARAVVSKILQSRGRR